MKKRLITGLVLFLLVLSSLSLAQNEADSCSGFFGKVKCLLFGNPDKRAVAGSAWYERGALVGK